MPINVSISKEDMMSGKILQPGVYVLLIKDISQAPGKADPDTQTTTIKFVVESGPDPKGVGVPIDYYIGEKSWKYQRDFLEKAFGKSLPEDGVNLDIELLKGRRIKGYVKSEKFQGRDKNKIDGFMPMSA